MKDFIIADDFGLSSGINRAIIELAQRRKIHAVSCMTVYPEFLRDSSQLIGKPIHIGIHLTLTGKQCYPLTTPTISNGLVGNDGRFWSSTKLAIRAYLKRLSIDEIYCEFLSQLNVFRQTFHKNPDHLDSHEHVHQLPQIRDALLKLIDTEGLSHTPVRTTTHLYTSNRSFSGCLKKYFLRIQGRRLRRHLLSRQSTHTQSIVGILDYRGASLELIRRCEEIALRTSSWWIVHPGLNDELLSHRDELTFEREIEYAFLLARP